MNHRRRKPLLCRLGLHLPDSRRIVRRDKVKHRPGRGDNKYHHNYIVCARCGKRLKIIGAEAYYSVKCKSQSEQ